MARKFKYSARTKEGAIVKGSMEAKDTNQVVETLQKKDLVIVEVAEDIGLNFDKLKEINIGGVPMKDKVIFMRQLSTMISAGLALPRALQILREQAQNPRFKKVLGLVISDIEGGLSLSASLAKYPDVFDTITINLIDAGEQSGNLDTILARLAIELEKNSKVQQRIKSATTYPIIILVVVITVVVLLMVVLVPSIKQMFDDAGAELPWVTKAVIAMSNTFVNYWWVFLIFAAVVGIVIKVYTDTPSGKLMFSKIALKIPVFGKLISNIQIAQFSRILSLLMKSGLPILSALELTSYSLTNLVFRFGVQDAKKDIEKGIPLALPLSRVTAFPLIVSQMVAVGEETGKLDEVLGKLSEYYEEEVEVMSDTLSTLLEPVMLIIMGVIVGFIALAVYMPMFSLSSAFGG